MQQRNFVLTEENHSSPIIITVPHGGIKNGQGSWLNLFFKERIKSEKAIENFIDGEKIVFGGDGQIMHIVADIIKKYEANVVVGLLPRLFVDYNRFNRKVAYFDEKMKPFYLEYHRSIDKIIRKLLVIHKNVILFDFHGFGNQPIKDRKFDIILGTDNQSSPKKIDKFLYSFFKKQYEVFCSGMDGLPEESDMYKGDTTNLFYYKKYGIDSLLVEIAPRFRSPKILDSKKNGEKLADDFSKFFAVLDKKTKENIFN